MLSKLMKKLTFSSKFTISVFNQSKANPRVYKQLLLVKFKVKLLIQSNSVKKS